MCLYGRLGAYDTATVNWGNEWRMPTKAEQDELRTECVWEWTTMNGINGYKVKSRTNGNSILLPAAGYRISSSFSYEDSRGYYWSATPDSGSNLAYNLYFGSGNYSWDILGRYSGRTVRSVSDK